MDYKIINTRLKGNKLAIVCIGNGTGFATNTDLLARNFGKYSGRYKGYIVSMKRAVLFKSMHMIGWQGALLGGFYPPKGNELEHSHIQTLKTAEIYHRRILNERIAKKC